MAGNGSNVAGAADGMEMFTVRVKWRVADPNNLKNSLITFDTMLYTAKDLAHALRIENLRLGAEPWKHVVEFDGREVVNGQFVPEVEPIEAELPEMPNADEFMRMK